MLAETGCAAARECTASGQFRSRRARMNLLSKARDSSLAVVLLIFGCLALRGQSPAPQPPSDQELKRLADGLHWQKIVLLLEPLPSRSAGMDFYLGIALAQLGSLPEAKNALEAGRSLAPHDPRFPVELAGIAFKQKDIRERFGACVKPSALRPTTTTRTIFWAQPTSLKEISKPLSSTGTASASPGLRMSVKTPNCTSLPLFSTRQLPFRRPQLSHCLNYSTLARAFRASASFRNFISISTHGQMALLTSSSEAGNEMELATASWTHCLSFFKACLSSR